MSRKPRDAETFSEDSPTVQAYWRHAAAQLGLPLDEYIQENIDSIARARRCAEAMRSVGLPPTAGYDEWLVALGEWATIAHVLGFGSDPSVTRQQVDEAMVVVNCADAEQ